MTSGSHQQLARHLEQWVHAYGADLAVPPGEVLARPATPPADAEGAAEAPARAEAVAAEAVASEAVASEAVAAATAGSPSFPPPKPPQQLTETNVADDPGSPTATPPATAAAAAEAALRTLRAEVLPCTKCKLHQGRQQVVFGEGNPTARVMFVGEAPGAREDRTGRPFVGESGELLERILNGAMGLHRSDVYIANVNKCRPPGNRNPEADEVAACLPFLRQQIDIVQPEVLVCLGRVAAQNLLSTTESTRAMRGRELSYAGIPVVVTWHPAYLLREPSRKRETWEDIKRVNRLLGLPEVPATGG